MNTELLVSLQELDSQAAARGRPESATSAMAAPMDAALPRSGGEATARAKDHLSEHGYVVVDGLVPVELLLRLRAAARRLVPRVRGGGRQLDARVPGLQNDLLRSDSQSYVLTPLGNEPCFAEYYASLDLLRFVTAFLERSADQLCLGDFALFAQREESEFNSSFHRDARWREVTSAGGAAAGERHIDGDAVTDRVAAEDRRRMTVAEKGGVGFHLALLDDSHFELIPGSHRRARTQAEMDEPAADIPQAQRVHLRAGQTLFWDGDSIHRGVPTDGSERLTLHACWGSVTQPIANGLAPSTPFLCDPRWLHWLHPGVREFLDSVSGVAVPGVLATAWSNFVRTRALPAEVSEWNATHLASEPPGYSATTAVEAAVARGEGKATNFWAQMRMQATDGMLELAATASDLSGPGGSTRRSNHTDARSRHGMAGCITPEALAEFDRDGLTTYGGPFTPAQLTTARDAFDATPSIAAWQAPAASHEDDGRGRYRAITSDPTELAPPLIALAAHPALEQSAAQVLRSSTRVDDDRNGLGVHILKVSLVCSFAEPKDSSTSYTYHTDTEISERNFEKTPRVGLTAAMWVWLSDVPAGCACLMVCRGSHRALAAELAQSDPAASAALPAGARARSTSDNRELDEMRRSLGDGTAVQAHAGQISVVTTACLHRASPNRSSVPRRLMIVTFGTLQADPPRPESVELRERLPAGRKHLAQLPPSPAL